MKEGRGTKGGVGDRKWGRIIEMDLDAGEGQPDGEN